MSDAILPLNSPPSDSPVPLIDLVEQYETIREEIQTEVTRVFESQRFVLGDDVAEFEQEMARWCDSRHAVGCGSGTDALILALQALEIGPGDEVITTPFSFFATASCIHRVGARVVFVDIEPDTFNLDPEKVAEAITPRTKAILPVHLFGHAAEMEPLWRLAIQHGLSIVEDAAQAIGASYRGRKAGVLGTVGCFSFFPTKNLGGAGDGGMITTDDPDLAARLKRLRVHGDSGRYHHVEVGLNSRLDALQAAVLKVKLRHLQSWADARSENAARYTAAFNDSQLSDLLTPPTVRDDCGSVWNQFCVRVTDGLRDAVKEELTGRQVGSAVYYPTPLHLQPCFEYLGYETGDFPIAEQACAEVLALPIYPELGQARQERVIEAVRQSVAAVRDRRTIPFPSERKAA